MADQIIIEFVGDTTKLEEAYDKLNEQVTTAGNLNKESASAFQKANADLRLKILKTVILLLFICAV